MSGLESSRWRRAMGGRTGGGTGLECGKPWILSKELMSETCSGESLKNDE